MNRKIKDVLEEHANWLVNPYTPISKDKLEIVHVRLNERDTNHYIDSLVNYIENILKESYEYGTLLLAIQLLTDVLENINYKQAKLIDEKIYNLFVLLRFRLGVERVASMSSEETRILQSCELYFQNFYVRYLDNMKKSKAEMSKEYEFLIKIMVETEDVEAVRKILAKKPNYVNLVAENGRSLFYVVAQKYITTKEEKYLRFLVIILESPNFRYDSNEVRTLYESTWKMIHTKLKDKYVILLNLLLHYFRIDDEQVELYNSFSAVCDNVIHDEGKNDMIGRVDITSLKTVVFANYKESFSYGVDFIGTYSLDITENGFDVYYHFPDVDSVVGRGSEEDRRAGHLIESFYHNKRAVFLFDPATLDKIRFEKEKICEAISFRVRVNKKGQVRELSVFPSVISLDKIYDSKGISSIKDINSHSDIGVYENISKLFRRDDANYTAIGRIVEPLSELLESCIYCLGEGAIPFIYRNVLSSEDMDRYIKRENTIQIIDDSWNAEGRKYFKNAIKHKRDEIVVYSTELLKCPLKKVRSVPIISPEVNYVALENLRLIKDFVRGCFGTQAIIYSVGLLERSSKIIRSGTSRAERIYRGGSVKVDPKASGSQVMGNQRLRLLAQAIVASTVNRSHYKESTEVKRLLHNM